MYIKFKPHQRQQHHKVNFLSEMEEAVCGPLGGLVIKLLDLMCVLFPVVFSAAKVKAHKLV